jgi:hypothetical protein
VNTLGVVDGAKNDFHVGNLWPLPWEEQRQRMTSWAENERFMNGEGGESSRDNDTKFDNSLN